MDGKSRRLLVILAASAVPFFAIMVWALTAVFGNPAVGVRCERSAGSARCAVLESRFLGLAGNGGFALPESEIAGVETVAPLPHVGRGSGEYSVSLILKSGAYRSYPVMHSRLYARAEAATRKLGEYFANPAATSVEVTEDSSEIVLFVLAPPVILAVVLGAVAARRRRQRYAAG